MRTALVELSLHRVTITKTISESDRRLATPLWRAHIAESARKPELGA
jgi:hypothetical protein